VTPARKAESQSDIPQMTLALGIDVPSKLLAFPDEMVE